MYVFAHIFENSLLFKKLIHELGNFLENLDCRISLTSPLISILSNLCGI